MTRHRLDFLEHTFLRVYFLLEKERHAESSLQFYYEQEIFVSRRRLVERAS